MLEQEKNQVLDFRLRTVVVLSLSFYVLAAYLFMGKFGMIFERFFLPLSPWDKAIPFLPWTFWIYISLYVLLPLTFSLFEKKSEIILMGYSFMSCVIISQVIWFVFPVEYSLRPNLSHMEQNFFINAIALLYALDTPAVNCYPSLHVSGSWLCFYLVYELRPQYKNYFFSAAVLISLSTLTFKQHYIADMLAGFSLAFLIWMVVIRRQIHRSPVK